MNKVLLGAAVLLTVASTQVMAGPNWDEVSVSYISTEFDDGEDIDGFGISGTKLINSNFFVAGSYSSQEVESFNDFGFRADVDFNSLSLGIGARKAVANNTDVYGVLSYESREAALSSGFSSATIDDIDGYGVTAGVRTMMTPKVELNAAVNYLDLDDVDSDTSFEVGGAFHFNSQFAVEANYEKADEADVLTLSGTFKF